MIIGNFQRLLRQRIGLDPASLGASAIGRAVETRMAVCNIKDAQAYWTHIHDAPAEFQELVEALVVPETWFFRDTDAFTAMADLAREALSKAASAMLRLLSLPCSTGEEPYSMAMALMDAGVAVQCFRIDAIDISVRALAQAEDAIYGKNSFRGNDLGFRDRYFELAPQGYRLAEDVRASVRFKHGNLFELSALTDAEVYDIIFCRNILIYLHGEAQRRAIGLVGSLLSAQGSLFTAPSEAGLLLNCGFVSTKHSSAFAFRRAGATGFTDKRRDANSGSCLQISPFGPPLAAPYAAPVDLQIEGRSAPAADQQPRIEEIRSIADSGRLAEARRLCEEYLRDSEPSTAALHLLGLIRDATGNSAGAADCYRKALYLDPKDHQSLAHLALLLERQGDAQGAKVLNERLRRLDRSRV